MNEDFCCPECNGTEFKKEYKSEHNIETYCTRCGLILKKDGLADEYDNTGWSEKGFRPNSWNICYANNVCDYFTVLAEVPNSEDDYVYNEHKADDYDANYTSEYMGNSNSNLSENGIFHKFKVTYDEYLKVNSFKDNIESKLKYLRRYSPVEFNKYHKDNMSIVKQSDKKDVQRPKYKFMRKG